MRYLYTLAVTTLVGSIGVAHAKLPDIDNSDWAADPLNYGMTAAEYINAESHAFFAEFIGRAGINHFSHFKTVATADDTWIVSPNVDTLYSIGIVNVTEGFTLEIPDTGDRFLSIQITDENHITPLHLYGGGVGKFTADQFETDFVGIGLRIGTDGTPEDIATIVETIQLRTRITRGKRGRLASAAGPERDAQGAGADDRPVQQAPQYVRRDAGAHARRRGTGRSSLTPPRGHSVCRWMSMQCTPSTHRKGLWAASAG
jgi:hypothetical protein